MHICISKIIIIDSGNGLSPVWCLAIIWSNAGILLIGALGTNFNEILFEIRKFSFKKMHLKMSSVKWQLFCLGLNVLTSADPVLTWYMNLIITVSADVLPPMVLGHQQVLCSLNVFFFKVCLPFNYLDCIFCWTDDINQMANLKIS